MATIYISQGVGKPLLRVDTTAGARVGRWCKGLPGMYPDRCENCYDRKTFQHYPATAYVVSGGYRHGRCRRCSRPPVMKPYR